MKNRQNFKINIVRGGAGRNIFLLNGGERLYVATMRENPLWSRIPRNVTLGELRRTKPKPSRAGQAYYKRVQHLVQIVDDFVAHEIAA